MMPAKMRLLVAAGLFVAWIGWLVYLVAHTRDPVIISRPQLLAADLIVTAHIDGDENQPNDQIKIEQVLWAGSAKGSPAKNDTLGNIFHLKDCNTPHHGWFGPGLYVLALKKRGGVIAIQEIPSSPGYPPDKGELRERFPRLRLYRATADAVRQAEDFLAQRKQS